jgi:hypothetical protein
MPTPLQIHQDLDITGTTSTSAFHASIHGIYFITELDSQIAGDNEVIDEIIENPMS